MYNRYIPRGNTYERVVIPEDSDFASGTPPAPPPVVEAPPLYPGQPAQQTEAPTASPPSGAPPGNAQSTNPSAQSSGLFGANSPLKGLSALFGGGKGGGLGNSLNGLGGLLKNLKLDQFDSGDILLVLIILFLYLEGDNLEMVITLGLMLLMGL